MATTAREGRCRGPSRGRLAADARQMRCSSRSPRKAGHSEASSCCAPESRSSPPRRRPLRSLPRRSGSCFEHSARGNGASRADGALVLAGDALGAALDGSRGPEEIARVACRASGAEAALLWQPEDSGPMELIASAGPTQALAAAPRPGSASPLEHEPLRVEQSGDGSGRATATLTLGQPVVGVLQLVFGPGEAPSQGDLERLGTFAVRAAQALRAGERARSDVARAGALARAAHGRRPGDRRALARAHDRHRGRTRVRAAARGAGGDLPRRREPPEPRSRRRLLGGARRGRATARARLRPAPRPGHPARHRRAGRI